MTKEEKHLGLQVLSLQNQSFFTIYNFMETQKVNKSTYLIKKKNKKNQPKSIYLLEKTRHSLYIYFFFAIIGLEWKKQKLGSHEMNEGMKYLV